MILEDSHNLNLIKRGQQTFPQEFFFSKRKSRNQRPCRKSGRQGYKSSGRAGPSSLKISGCNGPARPNFISIRILKDLLKKVLIFLLTHFKLIAKNEKQKSDHLKLGPTCLKFLAWPARPSPLEFSGQFVKPETFNPGGRIRKTLLNYDLDTLVSMPQTHQLRLCVDFSAELKNSAVPV